PIIPYIYDDELFDCVFYHKSLVEENKIINKTNLGVINSKIKKNQVLAVIGESFLSSAVTLIINENFPDYNHQDIIKLKEQLVKDEFLDHCSTLYELDKEFQTKYHENVVNNSCTVNRWKRKIYVSIFLSYIGALVQQNDLFDTIKDWINVLIQPNLESVKANLLKPLDKTAKSELYKLIGSSNLVPKYDIIETGDSLGLRPYVVNCAFNNEVLGKGIGPNFKEASLRAAMAALENKEKIDHYIYLSKS
ncbi:uncharacterized protein ASCRUDRAFT_16866, partial [Ascoidea rubescens DSM 1968]